MTNRRSFSPCCRALILAVLCLPQAVLVRADDVVTDSEFRLKPEWSGPCRYADVIDVNLGNSPEAFIRAAYGQVTGQEPSGERVAAWAARLRTDTHLRRIDVVRSFCKESGRNCKLRYSDPWLNNPDLAAPCVKNTKRDVGAVVMFFFHCPGGVNCGMDWANTHAYGMGQPSPILAWGDQAAGVYDAGNPGFWRRELRDARFAGLDFILPNVYGPDMLQEGKVATLAAALRQEQDPVKVGLFDDTWAWGEKWFGPYWLAKPDLSDTEAAASKLYEAKWKPFFTQVPRKYWYEVDRKPFICFYNSNKLKPRRASSAVLSRMKQMFRRDFGVDPFLFVDRAYFEDRNMPAVADAKFIWDTIDLPGGISRFKMKGHTLCHAMVKWDSLGRDHRGAIAAATDKLLKGPERLEQVLRDSADADILMIGTWNDLGEGTGVHRNYDYYYRGQWLPPDYFMRLIRQSQCR